jgi:transcriptional regulator with XRE-family HTH domain
MTLQWTEGDVIRKLRSLVGFTLTDLATVSGVNLQVIHRLESGTTKEPKHATLARLAGAFGLTERQLTDAVPPAIDLPTSLPKKVDRDQRRARRTRARAAHSRTVTGQKGHHRVA